MTKNQEGLTNPKILGILIVTIASVLVITAVSSQNAIGTIITNDIDLEAADIDVEEAEEAGNATTRIVDSGMNQTIPSNMTETN